VRESVPTKEGLRLGTILTQPANQRYVRESVPTKEGLRPRANILSLFEKYLKVRESVPTKEGLRVAFMAFCFLI